AFHRLSRASKGRDAATRRRTPRRFRVESMHGSGSCRRAVAIRRERPERKVGAVPVIAEVEHAREARSGEARVAPEPVRPLRAQEVLDAAPHGVRSRLSRGDQREHRPGTLVRGARRAGPGAPGLVAVVALAPAAVRILPALEPAHRADRKSTRLNSSHRTISYA